MNVELSEKLTALARALGSVQVIPDEGFTEEISVETSDKDRRFNVQGARLENTGLVSLDCRFNNQAARSFRLDPGDSVSKVYRSIYLTPAIQSGQLAQAGKVRSYSTADVLRGVSQIQTNPGPGSCKAKFKVIRETISAPNAPDQMSAQPVPCGFSIVLLADRTNTVNIFIANNATAVLDPDERFPLSPGSIVTLKLENFDQIFWTTGTVGQKIIAMVEVD